MEEEAVSPYSDRGIWKSASPANGEGTPSRLYDVGPIPVNHSQEDMTTNKVLVLSAQMKKATPSAAPHPAWSKARGSHAESDVMANCQSGEQQQGSHRHLPVGSSHFCVSGPEALTITRDRKERTIFQPSPQSF